MKKYAFLLLAAVAILLFSFCPAEKWTKYTSRTGHFSIEFPGAPSEMSRKDTSDPANPADLYYVTYFPNDSMGYMVHWVDLTNTYPKDKPMKQILEESRDGAMRTIRATDVITTATNLEKDPYIEFAFTSPEFTGRARVYIINKFQYAVMTLFPRSIGVSPNANKFIKSFRHIQ